MTPTGFRADFCDQSSPLWCFLIIWPLWGKKKISFWVVLYRGRSKRWRLCAFKKCAEELFSPSASVVSLKKVRLEGSRTLVPIQIVTRFVRGRLGFCVVLSVFPSYISLPRSFFMSLCSWPWLLAPAAAERRTWWSSAHHLWLQYPGLSSTPVPDCSVTFGDCTCVLAKPQYIIWWFVYQVFSAPVFLFSFFPWLGAISFLCFSLATCLDRQRLSPQLAASPICLDSLLVATYHSIPSASPPRS